MSTRVTVEGHADSRGTSEYNLALGERRATAVRDYLVSLGVDSARVNMVSMGEEQPVCREEAESCWAQNRRGHSSSRRSSPVTSTEKPGVVRHPVAYVPAISCPMASAADRRSVAPVIGRPMTR